MNKPSGETWVPTCGTGCVLFTKHYKKLFYFTTDVIFRGRSRETEDGVGKTKYRLRNLSRYKNFVFKIGWVRKKPSHK